MNLKKVLRTAGALVVIGTGLIIGISSLPKEDGTIHHHTYIVSINPAGEVQSLTQNSPFSFEKLASLEKEGMVIYEITPEQAKKIEKEWGVEIVDDELVIAKGEKALALETQETERFNEEIYKEIAETEDIKQGKIVVGADYSAEDAKILELQSKLK
jgi:hypothetical protein